VDVRTVRYAEEVERTRSKFAHYSVTISNHPGHSNQKSHGRKGGGGGGRVEGKDLSGDRDLIARADAQPMEQISTYAFADRGLTAIQEAQGFNGEPKVVSREEFDRALAAGEVTEAHRGLTGAQAEQFAEEYRSGPHWPGFGQYGSGTYATTDPAFFESQFGGGDPDWQIGATLRIGLRSDARVAPVSEIRSKLSEFQRANPGMSTRSDGTAGNLGRFAATLGYDAMSVEADDELVILNRTAVIVEEA
jgi:hypothetical protein